MPSPADRLRARVAAGPVTMPGVHDALSARLAALAGFDVVFVSGYAVSAARLAAPDIGYVTASDMSDATREACRAADRGTLVMTDADTGYGNALSAVRTARELHAAGAAGVFLEDQEWPKRCGHMAGKRVVPAGEWLAKLRAVRALRDEGVDLFLVARTDALAAEGIDEALRRARASLDAGADGVFVEAPRSRDDLAAVATATPGAVRVANMVPGGVTPVMGDAELAALGFGIVVAPLVGLSAATGAMRDAFAALARGEGPPPPPVGFGEMNALMGLDEHRALEARFPPDAPGASAAAP
ncbi:MAG: isocitrate lyase/PEP mutase family protein [Thermoleophilia bacterium]|nr:isocitrate lyase/PEP mutase family protein [Thermoleophilia bacterium]